METGHPPNGAREASATGTRWGELFRPLRKGRRRDGNDAAGRPRRARPAVQAPSARVALQHQSVFLNTENTEDTGEIWDDLTEGALLRGRRIRWDRSAAGLQPGLGCGPFSPRRWWQGALRAFFTKSRRVLRVLRVDPQTRMARWRAPSPMGAVTGPSNRALAAAAALRVETSGRGLRTRNGGAQPPACFFCERPASRLLVAARWDLRFQRSSTPRLTLSLSSAPSRSLASGSRPLS